MVAVGLLDAAAIGLLGGVLRGIVVGKVVSALSCTLCLSLFLFLPFPFSLSKWT